MTAAAKIKVLCVDDSALIRSLMTEIINSQPDMEVVGTAPDPLVAREMIKRLNPDVLTLDVEMPRMDGLDFLERLMRLRPMPVLMVSSLTERGSEITMRALELGAVDFITKPKLGIRDGLLEYTDTIADKLRAASRARPRPAALEGLLDRRRFVAADEGRRDHRARSGQPGCDQGRAVQGRQEFH
uniref:response regulator n=1 Tax=Cupriavidus gilardii TaxID=82541 RepID=UPI000B105B53